jgi:glycosyltransferase involved in cell wall biosynthesis
MRAGLAYDVVFYTPWIGSLLARDSALPAGGAETQVYLLARELVRLGVRVCAVSYETPGLAPDVDGIAVVTRPPPRWREIKGPAGKLAEVTTILRTVASLDAPVFVQRGTSMETGLVGLGAKARRRRFVYSSANEVDFDWGSVARRHNVALFELGVRLADVIVVQTNVQERLCRERFGREPILIRSLVEPAPPRRVIPRAFIWIGKLAVYKRPLEYVELAKAVPEARFWMVGVPSEKDSPALAAEVARAASGLANLELLDPRPRTDLMKLVDQAIAIVTTSEYEGMANVVLEGWARGVPALSLSHDPDRLIESERLGGCADSNRERLAALAREMWQGRLEQDEVAERCRAYVERQHAPRVAAERWLGALELAGNISGRLAADGRGR